MDVTRAKHRDLHRDAIADALRESIISGRIGQGERLREELLAEEFGVSRVPVREALSRLESEGFLTIAPFRGASVSKNSERDVLEHMQVRRGLEVLAAQLAAEKRGGEVRDELRAIVQRGFEAAQGNQLKELPDISIEFHRLVYAASGNERLRQMLETLLKRISWGFRIDLKYQVSTAWSDHATIASAILGGSPVQAGHLMNEHVARDEERYRQLSAKAQGSGQADISVSNG
nr:GntR family transcriptional regulator [Micromonospora sp. DSM 115978]